MMDMRPGQGPLMPTLAPPLGLGLPPGHLGLPHPHPFQTPDLSSGVRPQSVPSSPSPGRPGPPPPAHTPHLSVSPAPSNNKSTFAAALRDLAKNAVDPVDPRHRQVSGPPAPVSSGANTVTSSLLDVRKGFGRTTPAETRATPTPGPGADASPAPPTTTPTMSSSPSLPPPGPSMMSASGFQPYRSHFDMSGRLQPQPGAAGYHPAMLAAGHGAVPGIPSPFGPEADPLFQAQMARYAAAAASLGVSPGVYPGPGGLGSHLAPGGPPGMPMFPGGVLPPALLASYPPELLQAYGLAGPGHGFPPTSAAAVEMARMHEKLRSDEVRRLELEARKEADRREQLKTRDRERSSPAPLAIVPPGKKSSSDALLKLSKIASHQPDIPMQRLQPSVSQSCKNEIQSKLDGNSHPAVANKHGPAATKHNSIPSDIKLPTTPLDFSELSVKTSSGSDTNGIVTIPLCSPSDSVKSASPSPSPPPDPNYTVSRCMPYVPKPRNRSAVVVTPDVSDVTSASTPKKLFVRPFEDDYSPIQPQSSGLGSAEEPLDISASSLSPNKDCKQGESSETNVDLDDIVKPDDQDSDYESMSSDSSIKKEGSVLCPSSGHLLTDDETLSQVSLLPKLGVFREPEPDTVSRRDKLNYLRYFRLVTHRKKNDIEIEKLEKRKERLRERSPSPIAVTEDRCSSPELPLPSVPPHLNRLPETHAKAMYLSAIGLCRNSEEQKVSNEIMWSVILDDRLTRETGTPDKRSVITKYFVKLRDLSQSQTAGTADNSPGELNSRGVKRSFDGSFLSPVSGQAVASSDGKPVNMSDLAEASSGSLSPRYNGLNIPSSDAVSALSRLGNSDNTNVNGDNNSSSPSVSLPSSVEINLCSLQPIAKPTLLLQEVKTEPGSGGGGSGGPASAPPTAPPAHLQPHLSYPRVLSSSPFKSEVKTEPEDLTVTKKKKSNSSYSWPGVEAILESYKKFTAECEQEKTNLLERQSRVQQEVISRRGQVDTMSTRLSSLARLHKTLVGNHGHTNVTLDNLRSQLVAISKLVNTNQ